MTPGPHLITGYKFAGLLFDIRLYQSNGYDRNVEVVLRSPKTGQKFNSGIFAVDEQIFDFSNYAAQIAQRCLMIFNKKALEAYTEAFKLISESTNDNSHI